MILYAHVRACMCALSVIGLYVTRVTRDVILWRLKRKRRAFSKENINDRYEKSFLRKQDSNVCYDQKSIQESENFEAKIV